MAFSNRNLLPKSLEVNVTIDCTKDFCIAGLRETGYCPPFCVPSCNQILLSCPPYFPDPEPDFSPPPPPPLSPPSLTTSTNQSISPVLLILVSILGATFLLLSYYAIIVKCCSCWTTLRRPSQQPDDAHEDFIDENHGPFVDNPIWFITRIGIQDSIINSITVCKYKRGEGLIEGTECSVCLNEFQEDETLRLLPKCNHAFHPPCIDTWLRSHTNCPLCRAPIISNASGSSFTETVPNLNSLSPGNEAQLENSQDDSGFGADQVGEVGLSVLGENEEFEIAKEGLVVPSLQANSRFRVLSDLAENHRVVVDEDIQPVRRSVSMDSSSASMIALSVATFLSEESEGCSDNQLVTVNKSNSGADLGNGNSTISKPMGTSSSIGRSIQKEPISMRRSFSWGGKLLMSRNSRNRNSILPL